ncbi:helix-turn-helix domain-containing protein [Mycolicibacterium celeriflavum]|nr:helix-turn-helix domain-containing protein [Mycolicibacterium celeriflavum]
MPGSRRRPAWCRWGKVGDTDTEKARQLRDKGIAATDIAKMLGLSRATVYRYLADEEIRPRRGWPRRNTSNHRSDSPLPRGASTTAHPRRGHLPAACVGAALEDPPFAPFTSAWRCRGCTARSARSVTASPALWRRAPRGS